MLVLMVMASIAMLVLVIMARAGSGLEVVSNSGPRAGGVLAVVLVVVVVVMSVRMFMSLMCVVMPRPVVLVVMTIVIIPLGRPTLAMTYQVSKKTFCHPLRPLTYQNSIRPLPPKPSAHR